LKTHEQLAAGFLAEIEAEIKKHGGAYARDAFWHQAIVIGSAACGLVSLFVGVQGHGALAGALGGATTIASVLTQTLHCVKAQGWQDRIRAELEGIRIQYVYEHGGAPTPEALADLGKQYRNLVSGMSKEWEKVLNSQGGGFNFRVPKTGKGAKERPE
jgi:hypothetical protein